MNWSQEKTVESIEDVTPKLIEAHVIALNRFTTELKVGQGSWLGTFTSINQLTNRIKVTLFTNNKLAKFI